jgi:transposase
MEQQIRVLGVDLAKQVFHLVGMDAHGTILGRTRRYRAQVMACIAQLPPTRIGMEACGGAHAWACRFREHGHAVKLMAPPGVKPYVQANKHDRRDADAMAEAVTRPTMRLVAVKSVAQPDVQALHRVRERLMQAQTALINETRGRLHEEGMIVPPGAATFRTQVLAKVATEDAKLTPPSLGLFRPLLEAWDGLAARIPTDDAPLAQVAQTHPVCPRLMTIPGVGELPATALVAAVSDAAQFNNGRQFAAWLGLVPRQHRTGGKPRLWSLSTHAARDLRQLLGHGARSGLRWIDRQHDRRSRGVRSVLERRGWNRATVALANNHARIAWVLMGPAQVSRAAASGTPQHPRPSQDVATPHAFRTMLGESREEVTGQTGVPRSCCGRGPARPIHQSGGHAQMASGLEGQAGFQQEAG